ncbi:SEC-C metal-binding domain-containing protein [Halobacteriovorax sp. HLS]|uniref:SEC-C metal-binding domain-containing protein n=1 Tax=Halobacteriovorax sp. HLS TaxID=2234000 RepID=UPI000FD7CEF8|nr:SEC-C metal-binding domain-containing protein [Halobacteriovorax sp. HLS]
MTTENEKNSKEESNEHVHVHGPNCNHGHHHKLDPIVRTSPKVGRNDPCTCGSQKKYKKCCGK